MAGFLITWKEEGWPHENILAMLNTLAEQGFVDQPWRLIAHRIVKAGDHAWLLRQGRGPKGIFGFGEITGPAFRGDPGNDKVQWMAPIRFAGLADPREEMLIPEPIVEQILDKNQIHARASGQPLRDEQTQEFERYVQSNGTSSLAGEGDWTPSELSAVVASYVEMLGHQEAGRPYSKTDHRTELKKLVERSSGAIERKHQNISAILGELGLPWINGYKPLSNYQDALVGAIEEAVERFEPDWLSVVREQDVSELEIRSVFVDPPQRGSQQSRNRSMDRIARKFDAGRKDAANRKLGAAGERFVLELERRRLMELGRADLAERVKWVSMDEGDGLGYDIASYEPDGTAIFVEVKTTRGGKRTPFYLTENERLVAAEKGGLFRLYRVFDFSEVPLVYTLTGPIEEEATLEPIVYRVRI